MATNRINIRLNDVKDRDIIEALDNAKDVTKEVKKLLRVAISNPIIRSSAGEVVEIGTGGFVPVQTPPEKPVQEFVPIAKIHEEPPVVLAEKQQTPTPIPAPVKVKPVAQQKSTVDNALINNLKSNF